MLSSESINFSCYIKGDKMEWLLDSGCTEHVTPVKSDFVEYTIFNPTGKANIAKRKYLIVEGWGMVIRHSILPDSQTVSLAVPCVLYIPKVNKWLYLLIATRQYNCKSKMTNEETVVLLNKVPIIIGQPKLNKLHYFNMVLTFCTNTHVSRCSAVILRSHELS